MKTYYMFALLAFGVAVTAMSLGNPDLSAESNFANADFSSETKKLVESLSEEALKIFDTTHTGFENRTRKINDLSKKTKQLMENGFTNFIITMKSTFSSVGKKLKSRGYDAGKYYSCVEKNEARVTEKINEEYKLINLCIGDATKFAQEKVDKARNSFADKTKDLSDKAMSTLNNLDGCDNLDCKNEHTRVLYGHLGDATTAGMKGLQKAKKGMKLIKDCTKDLQTFFSKMSQQFTTMVDTCVKEIIGEN